MFCDMCPAKRIIAVICPEKCFAYDMSQDIGAGKTLCDISCEIYYKAISDIS